VQRSTFRGAVAAVAAIAAALVLPAAASAADSAQAFRQLTGQQAKVTVNLKVTKFVATSSGPRARGVATATLSGLGSAPTTVKQRVTLQVTGGGRCRILRLTLQQLDLHLLGLNVHLDRVDLRITGRRRGGVLGRLFCALAGARVRTASAATAAHQLNARITKRPLRLFRLSVPVQAVAAQAPPPAVCPILELTLGPLHLDLLGLVIDLNRVHLTITATPGGGILGDLLCSLSRPPTTG
jgi:hypothetical protein